MLLPYTTDRPPRNPPVAVVSLVLVHFAVFGIVALIMAVRGPDAAVLWYANLSLVPNSFRPHTFITYAFLHENLFHVSVNMLFLWVFGGSVEDVIGWRRFAALYALGIVIAGALEFGMAAILGRGGNVVPIVGASGAISAVIGVFAFRFYRSSIRFIGLPFHVPAVLLLALVMVLEMGLALFHLLRSDAGYASQAAAHWAHVGGFLLGILWAKVTSAVGHGRQEYLAEDAHRAYERGAYPSAAHRWEELQRLNPQRLDYQAELGRSLLGMGDREHALGHFEAAIEGLLKSGDRTEAGIRYLQMGDLAEDLALSPSALLSISASVDEQSRAEDALQVLDRIMRDHAAAPEADIARLKSAALHLRLGNLDPARERALQYLERNPSGDLRSYAEDLLRRSERAEKRDSG